MNSFVLNEGHVRDGLSEKDFSDYAGFPVATFSLADFPHWEKLKAGEYLANAEMDERTNALFAALEAKGMDSHGFTMDDAEASAGYAYPNYRCRTRSISHNYDPHEHFDGLTTFGVDLFINAKRLGMLNGNHFFPGMLDEVMDYDAVGRKHAAFVLTDAPSTEARDFWARRTRLDSGKIALFPDEKIFGLLDQLHEMRHLVQLALHSPNILPRYYEEADADLFARSVIRQAGLGAETLRAQLYTRWIEMLLTKPKYWIAPVLEALEGGQPVPNFYDVQKADVEVRLRIIMEILGDKHRGIPSEALQHAVAVWDGHPGVIGLGALSVREVDVLDKLFTDAVEYKFSHNPERILVPLANVLERGDFQNPLAEKIAGRALEAVAYFNPAMVKAPAVRPVGIITVQQPITPLAEPQPA